MQNKIERNGHGEYVTTFRRSASLAPGNVLVTSEREYEVKAVNVNGESVFLSVEWFEGLDILSKIIELKTIDYVYIKLYL